jgi:hypothetical protein
VNEHPTLRRLRNETLNAACVLAVVLFGAWCRHAVQALLH